jgi:Arc/MetJ-type ribon-helix-helix transcriptional regulator
MKLSVSLPEDDVAFLDDFAQRGGARSRSSAIHRAIELLRMNELEEAYADAFGEWDDSAWETTIADGIADEEG